MPGNQEFSVALAEFSKAQIDAIQANVDTVQQLVNDMRNTDIGDLSAKMDGMGWWGKYQQRTKTLNNTTAANTAYYSVLEITGAGWIDYVGMWSSLNNWPIGIRVTIDGVVTVWNVPSGTGQLVSMQVLNPALGGWEMGGDIPALAAYQGPRREELLGVPLFFSTSLKVELINGGGTGAQTSYSYRYGVKL